MRSVPQERSGKKTAMRLGRGAAFARDTRDLGPAGGVVDDLPDFVCFSGE